MTASTAQKLAADRRAPRQRSFLRAKLAYLDGSVTYDCAVVQLSATGARIAIGEAARVPDRFRIEIPQKRISSTARLIRRDEDSAAIAFEAAEAASAMAPEALLERIKELEAENKTLRETCKALMKQIEAQSPSY